MILIPSILAALTLSPPPATETPAPEGVFELRGRGFSERSTEHFTVLTDAPAEWADRWMPEFDAAHNEVSRWAQGRSANLLFHQATGEPIRDGEAAKERTYAVTFSSRDDYESFGRSRGMESPRGVGFCSPKSRLILLQRMESDAAMRLTIRHEVAHRVLYDFRIHSEGRNPPWLVEGLACLFEAPQPGGAAGLQPNPWRLADLREQMKRLESRLPGQSEESKRARIASLLKSVVVRTSPMSAADPAAPDFYAASWGMVYFLARVEPKKFSTYVASRAFPDARQGIGPATALAEFELDFGPLDEAFAGRWDEYINKVQVSEPKEP